MYGASGAAGRWPGARRTADRVPVWRWCLYVNLFFAAIAAVGARRCCAPATHRPSRLDLLGVLLVSSGMFCIVYGFATPRPIPGTPRPPGGSWAPGCCCWPRSPVGDPRPRAAAAAAGRAGPQPRRGLLSILISGSGMFGLFLFLTYYLQVTALLPRRHRRRLPADDRVHHDLRQRGDDRLMPGSGQAAGPAGMLIAAAGMVWLTRIGLHSSYVTAVLLPTMVIGLGLGQIIAPRSTPGPSASPPPMRAWPRPPSTPVSSSAGRSAPPCSTRSPRAPQPATWDVARPPGPRQA